MIENPGLSYGLFHAVANPIYSWGVVRKVTFPGVNMDIGHVRNITWAKDNDEKKWVAYNRLRGQYMSALEHAVPERFFNDPQKCNLQGASNPTAGLPDCPQGISAVKALGLAAAQGQRIYTITQKVYNDNPNIVNTALSAHSYDTQSRVQQSLDAGYEVTIHESPIAESGWAGAGYIAIDPSTGAGAYTIEGGSNGAWIPVAAITVTMLAIVLGPLLGAIFLGTLTGIAGFVGAVALIGGVYYTLTKYIENINKIIDGDQGTNEQKAIMINVISALTAAVGAIGYYKAGKDFAAAAMGLMIGALGAAFQKVTDLLWGLF